MHLKSTALVSSYSTLTLSIHFQNRIKQTQQLKDYRPVSTLHLKSRNDHIFPARVVSTTLMAPEYHELKPKELDRGPIPVHNIWKEHAWILPRAMFPIMLQQASYFVFPGLYSFFYIFVFEDVN